MNQAVTETAFAPIFSHLSHANVYQRYITKKKKKYTEKRRLLSEKRLLQRPLKQPQAGINDIKEKEGDFAMNNIGATQRAQMD